MNKKLIVIIIVVVVLALGGAAYYYFFVAPNSVANNGTGSSPLEPLPPIATSTPPGPAPTGTTFTLGTPDGSVQVNNFYQNPDYVTQDGQTVVIEEKPQYSIVYNTADSSFIISILATPLKDSQLAAEQAFLKDLGVSQQDACKLKVSEGVPISVSDEYPGVNFGLSFCADSYQLE